MAYVDNQVPFGSRSEEFLRSGSSLGTYILESINIQHPSKIGERPNEIGEPNGWFAVAGFRHGTAVVQIPTVDSDYLQVGDYFEDDFGLGTERWVVVETAQPFGMADYYKMNITVRHSPNPPA